VNKAAEDVIRLGGKVRILNGGPELWVAESLKRSGPNYMYWIVQDGNPANRQWKRASELEAVSESDNPAK
jgi:hypothetical protein